MSAPATVSIILENLAAGALDVAPGDGRRPAVEADTEGVRAFLEAFAALPAGATEDADARIRLATPAHRLVVRNAGGRLIVEEADSFVAATVDEIVVRLFAPVAGKDLTADEATPEPSPSGLPRRRRKVWVLTGLLVVLPLVWWSTMNPETPDGVEWVQNAGERQAILTNANGQYASDDERLNVDGATAGLVVAAKTGEETLLTTLRVGRRAGVTVLVTEAGMQIEIGAGDRLSIGDAVYHRVPPVR